MPESKGGRYGPRASERGIVRYSGTTLETALTSRGDDGFDKYYLKWVVAIPPVGSAHSGNRASVSPGRRY